MFIFNREERQRPGSQYAAMIEQKIRDGQIVPVEVTCALIVAAMRRATATRFLVDGFPRNADNLTGWQKACSDTTRLLFVLFFECSKEECSRRCLARGAAGSGRSDDNEESLLKRFDTYVKDTLPVVNHYEQLGLVRRINADHDPDSVFEKVKAVFADAGIHSTP